MIQSTGCQTEGEYTLNGAISDHISCKSACEALNLDGCCEWQTDWEVCKFNEENGNQQTSEDSFRYGMLCSRHADSTGILFWIILSIILVSQFSRYMTIRIGKSLLLY